MARQRYIIEIGTGIDIHGEDATESACRAVRDAVSRSCLCGLVEILELKNADQMEVDILIASPRPEQVDLEKVKETAPAGRRSVKAVPGGMMVQGLLVPQFGPGRDQIMVTNAALTVYIDR